MFFYTFFRSRTQTAKPLKIIVFTMNLNDLTIQRNMISDDLHDLFRYLFWHSFLMSLGIDVGSMLAPLWHQIIVLGRLFGEIVFIEFRSKWFPKVDPNQVQFTSRNLFLASHVRQLAL